MELPTEEVLYEAATKIYDICKSEMKNVGKEFVHDELVYAPAFSQCKKARNTDAAQLLLTESSGACL